MNVAKTMKRCNRFLESYYQMRQAPIRRVLEAGGGSFSHFALPSAAELHVLDIEYGQLAKNAHTNLCIQGDLHHLPIMSRSLDMVVCFNVLEHLDEPQLALEEIVRSLAGSGVLLLGCPERNSLKGWITRITPLWFHRWYYRHAVGKIDRGDGHYDAFATPFRPIVSQKRLKKWLVEAGCEIVFFHAYNGTDEYQITRGNIKSVMFGVPYRILGVLGQILTLGNWRPLDSDLLLVAIRQPE